MFIVELSLKMQLYKSKSFVFLLFVILCGAIFADITVEPEEDDNFTSEEIAEIERILSRSHPKYASNITAIQQALGKLLMAEIVDPDNQDNLPSHHEVLILSRKLQRIGELLSASLSNGDFQKKDAQMMDRLERLEQSASASAAGDLGLTGGAGLIGTIMMLILTVVLG